MLRHIHRPIESAAISVGIVSGVVLCDGILGPRRGLVRVVALIAVFAVAVEAVRSSKLALRHFVGQNAKARMSETRAHMDLSPHLRYRLVW